MDQSLSRRVRASTDSKERLFKTHPDRRLRKNFGTIVLALWPDKPALNLAQRINTSERAANFYINGKRKLSARCIQVIVNEMLE